MVNKKDIGAALYETGDFSTQAQADRVVESFLDILKSKVQAGEKVNFAGFGSFALKGVKSRNARNPRTGETVIVPAHNKVKFVVAKQFKDSVK